MIHQYSSTFAAKHGFIEAVIYEYIRKQLRRNRSPDKYYSDGHMWFKCPAKHLSEVFPHWSESTVRRALVSLIKQKKLVQANLENEKYTTSFYYRLNYTLKNQNKHT